MIKFTIFWYKTWNYIDLLNFFLIYILILNVKNFYKNQYKFILFYKIIYIFIQSRLDFFLQHSTYINFIIKLFIKIILLILLKILIFKKNITKINKFFFYIKIYKNINFFIIIINYIKINPLIIFYAMINKNLYIFKNILDLLINLKYISSIFFCKIFYTKKKTILINKLSIIFNIFIGNYIYNNNKNIYNIYIICGKLYNIKLIKEQQIIGLILWIINNMMILILYKLL